MLRISRTTIGLLAMVFLLVSCTNGDGTEKRSRDAEEQGRRDVPLPTNPGGSRPDRRSWEELWRETPGTPEHRCVEVGTHRNVRSGEFVVGNFAAFIERWDGTLEKSKLYYIPAFPVEGQSLEVVAELLDPTTPQQVPFTFALKAWATDGYPFYASGTVLSVRGLWRLRATAGENTGCFELRL
ncbi:MAG: hypothetical protein ACRDJV_15610 [Actinomycetota bacterium]